MKSGSLRNFTLSSREFDMGRISLLSVFIAVAILFNGCQKKPMVVSFLDGNNNLYRYAVEQQRLEYKPVLARDSSSGTYSGGRPWGVTLGRAASERFLQTVKKAFQDTDAHSSIRIKGSSQLYIYYSRNSYRSVILKRSAAVHKKLLHLLSGEKPVH